MAGDPVSNDPTTLHHSADGDSSATIGSSAERDSGTATGPTDKTVSTDPSETPEEVMTTEERQLYRSVRVGRLVLAVIAAAFGILAAYKVSLGYLALTGATIVGLVTMFALGNGILDGKIPITLQLKVISWAVVVFAIVSGALGIFLGFRSAWPGTSGASASSTSNEMSQRAKSAISPPAPCRDVTPEPPPQAAFKCKQGMVPVTGRTYAMGSGKDEKQVTVGNYCIDKYEVTVSAYYACVDSRTCEAGAGNAHWSGYATPTQRDTDTKLCNLQGPKLRDHPVNCVNWDEADHYCRANGGRLPSEAEWEYAARGPEGREYPWDGPQDACRLNACGSECSGMRLYDLDDGWPTTAPVGSFPLGQSYFGAFDMAGNVWEWTADWYDDYKKGRVDRGGGWLTDLWWSVRSTHRSWDEPELRSPRVGFRCAADPLP